jgi:hypothetical protein
MTRFGLSFSAVFVAMSLASAEDERSLTLYPAPLPSPALKYRLLPELRSQTAGDAVPLYNDAITKFMPLQDKAFMQPGGYPVYEWAGTLKALKVLPRDEVRKFLEAYKEVLDLIDKAARCERCTGDGNPATARPVLFVGVGQPGRGPRPTADCRRRRESGVAHAANRLRFGQA